MQLIQPESSGVLRFLCVALLAAICAGCAALETHDVAMFPPADHAPPDSQLAPPTSRPTEASSSEPTRACESVFNRPVFNSSTPDFKLVDYETSVGVKNLDRDVWNGDSSAQALGSAPGDSAQATLDSAAPIPLPPTDFRAGYACDPGRLFHDLIEDERNFYSCNNLTWIALGVGGGATLANTNADQWFRQTYAEHWRPPDTNLDFVKDFGTGGIVIPAMAGLWMFDRSIAWCQGDDEWPVVAVVGDWSERSMRGWIVGAVPLLTLQYAIGAGRPGESSAGSHWTPFEYTHGVSGHAFIGAVPFFTAADMCDSTFWKVGFYTLGEQPAFREFTLIRTTYRRFC